MKEYFTLKLNEIEYEITSITIITKDQYEINILYNHQDIVCEGTLIKYTDINNNSVFVNQNFIFYFNNNYLYCI